MLSAAEFITSLSPLGAVADPLASVESYVDDFVEFNWNDISRHKTERSRVRRIDIARRPAANRLEDLPARSTVL